MRTPKSVKGAKEFGRIRLSPTFFMREFLYGEIANIHGMTNLPQDPDLVVDQRSTSWSPSPTLAPTASTRPGSATPRTLPR